MQGDDLRMFEVTFRIMPGRRGETLPEIDTYLRESTAQSRRAAPVHARDNHRLLHEQLPRPNLIVHFEKSSGARKTAPER